MVISGLNVKVFNLSSEGSGEANFNVVATKQEVAVLQLPPRGRGLDTATNFNITPVINKLFYLAYLSSNQPQILYIYQTS